MMKKTLVAVVVVGLIAVLALAGCSGSKATTPQEALVGTWAGTFNNTKVQEVYNADGTGVQSYPDYGSETAQNFTYTATDTTLTTTLQLSDDPNDTSTVTNTYKIDGKTLTISDDATGLSMVLEKQ